MGLVLSQHRIKQINIALFFILSILISLALGNLFEPYWTALIVLQIGLSALFGWIIALIFQVIVEELFEIRINIRGDTTLGKKFTKWWFGLIFVFIQFLFTSIIAFLFGRFADEWLDEKATGYELSNAPRNIMITSFVIAGLLILIVIWLNTNYFKK